ncbi:response regulator transcription factor [Aestuariicella hydrocarbonica]|uniref:Response regulator transcription factor n=1 Tax=Pseudomaricurvus hydrocarbonicus TaxID=1470433 RepID=A0A9E5MG09_9GAMM|nr:response regulator transcription factor [Aestuariicella hydrocarbonica]NHO64086.1 response regulator transcription factor [Aestuariicella hydrocarbonica]
MTGTAVSPTEPSTATPEGPVMLVVDDDAALTRVLARAFKRRGYRVFEANCSDAALSVCELHKPDRCVLDLKIAHESGLPLISRLKQLLPELEIVMLTGYSSINTAVEAIKLGATHYLCKPADADEIERAFGHRAGQEDTEIQATPPSVNRLEWEHIQKVLAEHDGNISATARALNMHRRTLQRKLQKRPVRQ